MSVENIQLKIDLNETQARLLEAQLHLLGYQKRDLLVLLEQEKKALEGANANNP